MAGGNPSKLKPCTPENARERQLKSAEKRKENNAKKKLMSQIYAEFLEKKYKLKKEGDIKEITGDELVQESMKKIIARGDSSSVSLTREIREGTEGTKLKLDGAVAVNNEMDTTEERLKKFKELMGNG
jgi:hypothetical protein